MYEISMLDDHYSTTRLVTNQQPVIEMRIDDKFETILFLPEGEGRQGEGGLRTKGYFKQNVDGKPLITVVTVVYNGEKFLEETIQSVINQNYDNVEYIIIDGGSNDGTLDIIRKYEHVIDYWVSEKDNGIGDAWNKGVTLSLGSLIGLLNADDFYDYENISNLSKVNSENDLIIYYGDCKFLDQRGISGVNKREFKKEKLIYGFGFTHTTCFKRREVYKKVGLFDSKYKIAVDTDFLLRCVKANVEFKKIELLTYMEMGGVSDKFFYRAYSEFLMSGVEHKVFKKTDVVLLKTLMFLYAPIRKILKNKQIKNLKHLYMFLWNKTYNFIPFFSLKNKFLRYSGNVVGKKSYIHSPVVMYRHDGLKIGNNSVINWGAIIDNREKISIGDNVSIAHNFKVYTCGHDVDSPFFDMKCKEVVIHDYACLFSNTMVMPGVIIGKGAVVLPGSVVTKNVESYSIVGGNPAVHKRYRDKNQFYKLDYGWWCAL